MSDTPDTFSTAMRADIGRSSLMTILTDSAAQTDRASPVVKGVTPDNWLPPGEAWFESFLECVARQVAEQTK